MRLSVPRLVVAGLSGDSGKTLVSLGLGRVLSNRGLRVQAFKKGPDFIDPAWLSAATRSSCKNLDTFLMSDEAIASSVASCPDFDFALIEGNRGLYDGFDAAGSHSTAELAKRLKTPVILVVDTTKTTRTVAAQVLGCRLLDPELNLAGVILNRVGTERQEALIRDAVESATSIPVVGAVRRIKGDDPLPGRHLGLVTFAEHPARDKAIERAAGAIEHMVDLEKIAGIAAAAPPLDFVDPIKRNSRHEVKLGYFEDQAFSFYYPENLEGLRNAGATLVALHPTEDQDIPEDVAGLYIGGGFPEIHAPALAENRAFSEDLQARVEAGMPVYAECGGLMYLARELRTESSAYPMAGVLDIVVKQEKKPQGHGYEVATVDVENPFFATGTALKGHEFHYSHIVDGKDGDSAVLGLDRGVGIGGGRDGIVKGSVWASYLHLHATGEPAWADGLLELASSYASSRAAAWA